VKTTFLTKAIIGYSESLILLPQDETIPNFRNSITDRKSEGKPEKV